MNSPQEIAEVYSNAGLAKTKMPFLKTFILAIFAGMFIALAGVGAAVASASIQTASVAKLVGACVFPAGLAMVLVAGSELFTGNNLIIIPVLEGKATVGGMLRNWVIVYIGNFVGSLIVAALCTWGNVYALFGGALAQGIVNTANAKVSMQFGEAMIKGILCNFLVCIAVWMSFGAKTVGGKIAAVFFPIMVFVVSGFEHSVANMYYISAGLFTTARGAYGVTSDVLNWGVFFTKNLIPVTLGNLIGGCVFTGAGYWTAYLRKK